MGQGNDEIKTPDPEAAKSDHCKGKVHRKKRKEKLTNVSFALTPTYVQ